jgi:hypothetical protein
VRVSVRFSCLQARRGCPDSPERPLRKLCDRYVATPSARKEPRRLRTLVSPVTFSVLARRGARKLRRDRGGDSGGRVELGILVRGRAHRPRFPPSRRRASGSTAVTGSRLRSIASGRRPTSGRSRCRPWPHRRRGCKAAHCPGGRFAGELHDDDAKPRSRIAVRSSTSVATTAGRERLELAMMAGCVVGADGSDRRSVLQNRRAGVRESSRVRAGRSRACQASTAGAP